MPTMTLPPKGSEPTWIELRALWLRASGRTNRSAGNDEHLSEHTVKTHLRRLYARLGVNTAAEAVMACYQRSLSPFEVAGLHRLVEFLGVECEDPVGAVINRCAAAERDLAELRAQQPEQVGVDKLAAHIWGIRDAHDVAQDLLSHYSITPKAGKE